MSFVSNVDHLILGDGVYNNVHGNLVHNTLYVRKRRREEISDAPNLLSSTEPTHKRRRREENLEDGIKVIRRKHLKLNLQIGRGPGYSLHAGETKGRAVIVKVFNAGPTVREQLESTVALSKGLLHPNVLRVEGVSLEASLTHFIAYENAYWKTAEGPLAAALKDDLAKSITLGFKMIAGLSAGMNHINDQGISMASLGAENFDIFLDVNDRFLISISPPVSTGAEAGDNRQLDNSATRSWHIFNALCQRVLRSANRVLHNENIERNPVIPDIPRRPPVPQKSLAPPSVAALGTHESSSSHNLPENEPSVPPRREYVWRTIDRGQQSLATVASRIALELDMKLSSLVNKLAWSHGRSAHRCAGYVRQEITLATKTGDSAVVSHDAPSPLEICSVCHEVVGVHEVFRCDCGDPNPGSRPTVKCQACKFWSHSDCVGDLKDFICQSCEREDSPPLTPPPLEDSRFYFGEDGSIHDSPRRLNTAVGSALCLICGRATLQWCARCQNAWYCSSKHFHSDWSRHRETCRPPPTTHSIAHSDDVPPAPKLRNISLPPSGRETPFTYEPQDLLFPYGTVSEHNYIFEEAHNGTPAIIPNNIFDPSRPDAPNDELSIFSGKTHTLTTKAKTPRPTQQPQPSASSPASMSTRSLSDLPGQTFTDNPSFAGMHPSLVKELNVFDRHINAQIQSGYYPNGVYAQYEQQIRDSPGQTFTDNPSFAGVHPSLVNELNVFDRYINTQIQSGYYRNGVYVQPLIVQAQPQGFEMQQDPRQRHRVHLDQLRQIDLQLGQPQPEHYMPDGALRGIAAEDPRLQEHWQVYMSKVGSPRNGYP